MSENNNREAILQLQAGDLTNTEGIELPVFYERSAITQQPTNDGFPGVRRPIPVSTIEWRSTTLQHFIPVTGLDFLYGVQQVNIQQTVELHDMLSQVESENRYTVKIPGGETLYLATESSTAFQRMCFGSSRQFVLTLYDSTRQHAMQFVRRLACTNCLLPCRLQEMAVWTPPGNVIGTVRQCFTLFEPAFMVLDESDHPLFKITGPPMCTCAAYKDALFSIFTADGSMQLGSIRHQWDQLMVGYNLCVYFPERCVDNREKALLLAAAFLLEYMYFERAKSSRTCSCLC